jgi:hypothetical protein
LLDTVRNTLELKLSQFFRELDLGSVF